MKDTLITAHRKKIELLTWLVCFAIANMVNLYAIISYKTSLWELFTSIFYVFTFSCVIYIFWTVIRLLYYRIKITITNKKNRELK